MKKFNNEKAIISLTSWKKRIDTVGITIQNIIRQMGKEFHIVLVLSEEEFPRKENELPKSLTIFVQRNLIEILWVKKNYKSFKKFIFTQIKYPNTPVITLDDGCVYLENVAENLYKNWIKKPNAIMGVRSHYKPGRFGSIVWFGGGRGVIYPPSVFNKFVKYLDIQEIISTNNDDFFFGFLADLLKIPMIEIKANKDNFRVIKKAEDEGLSKNRTYNDTDAFNILNRIFKQN